MLNGYFIFDGKNSRDYGVVIEKYPSIVRGIRRGDVYQIAGVNGSRVTEHGTYDNYIQPFDVAVREGMQRPAPLRGADLGQWLLGSSGYCRLETSFEPEYFRMARYAGPLNLEQIIGKWGRATLEFDCQPERYLISGEKAIDGRAIIMSGSDFILNNPTGFTARPFIEIAGVGDLKLTLRTDDGDAVFGLAMGEWAYLTIDSETFEVWDISQNPPIRADYLVTFYDEYHEFPVLNAGQTQIIPARDPYDDDSRVETLEVVPRWWTI